MSTPTLFYQISSGHWNELHTLVSAELTSAAEAWDEFVAFLSGIPGKSQFSRACAKDGYWTGRTEGRRQERAAYAIGALRAWVAYAQGAPAIGTTTTTRARIAELLKLAVGAGSRELIYDECIVNEVESIAADPATLSTLCLVREEVLSNSAKTLADIPEETPGSLVYVRLDQMAAIVGFSKRTLERAKNSPDSTMPKPAVEGGGGKADYWSWEQVRPWLEATFARTLPNQFPASRLTDS